MATTEPEQWIAGERAADRLLANIKSGVVLPGDLALTLGSLRGPAFQGACRLIEKTLGGRHA
jgi:hypothetical protein